MWRLMRCAVQLMLIVLPNLVLAEEKVRVSVAVELAADRALFELDCGVGESCSVSIKDNDIRLSMSKRSIGLIILNGDRSLIFWNEKNHVVVSHNKQPFSFPIYDGSKYVAGGANNAIGEIVIGSQYSASR